MRITLTIRELIERLERIEQHAGGRPVFVTDGFHKFGVDVYEADCGNFQSPNCVYIRPFLLESGVNTSSKLSN